MSAYTLRPYQQACLDALYHWWMDHPGVGEAPIMVLPTGAGKSIILAELCRLLFDTWPDEHPRTVILVPSKELAEQNAEKLVALLPDHLSVGYYSASIGRKQPNADVIVATIGSIYRQAHQLGNIKCVLIDECHLCNPNGTEAGRYRQFLTDLARYCTFRVAGCTATPFRGNGVWLTDGDSPLFTGICHEVKPRDLLEMGFLAQLSPPETAVDTRIDTSDVRISNGDFVISELSEQVDRYLPAVAEESARLAADRKKWLAFTATVANAERLCGLFNERGIKAAVVCGETPKQERAALIEAYRAGRLRCLVTVLALATGFDVPDVDCLIWCRPTQSPVLFVQGAGRGMRIAPGKEDCLWLDFSDTTERLGPVDAIRGRKKPRKAQDPTAPYAICNECGERVRPASALICPHCGAILREPEVAASRPVSTAPIMAHQLQKKLSTYDVTRVECHRHRKAGSPDSMRVDYFSGLRRVASEWICLEHTGWARAKAETWWLRRSNGKMAPPNSIDEALDVADWLLRRPTTIVVNESGRYPEIVKIELPTKEENSNEQHLQAIHSAQS